MKPIQIARKKDFIAIHSPNKQDISHKQGNSKILPIVTVLSSPSFSHAALRKYPPFLVNPLQAAQRDDVGGGAAIDVVFLLRAADQRVCLFDPPAQLEVDLIEFPGFAPLVLQPFKIADDHAARIAEDIRNQGDSLLMQYFISLLVSGTVMSDPVC